MQKLSSPTGLIDESVSENTITVTWNTVHNSTGYMINCKDVINKDWSSCHSLMVSENTNRTVIDQLYPTATFEIRITALGDHIQYEDSDESESIFVDTKVGSCAPEKKRVCCFM